MQKIASFAPLPWKLRFKEALCLGGRSFIVLVALEAFVLFENVGNGPEALT